MRLTGLHLPLVQKLYYTLIPSFLFGAFNVVVVENIHLMILYP